MRAELLFRGLKPEPLFSIKDKLQRDMLSKIKAKESYQLMAELSASLGDGKQTSHYAEKYRDSVWYSNITEDRNKRMFKEYFTNYKDMKPEIFSKDGVALVRGLN